MDIVWWMIANNMAHAINDSLTRKSGVVFEPRDHRLNIVQDTTGMGDLNYLRIFYRPIWRTPTCSTSIKDGTSPDVT